MEQILGVADWGSFATTANSAFLLAFSSLFSIINPMGGALIFYGFTKDFSSVDRVKVAARVGFYSLLIMFGALWTGTYILSFFGVSKYASFSCLAWLFAAAPAPSVLGSATRWTPCLM